MANENQTIQAPEAVSGNVAPNLDAELDAALGKSFPNSIPPNEPNQIEEPKAEAKAEPKVERKPEAVEESKKEDKPVEIEKIRLTPEESSAVEPPKNGWAALKNKNKAAHQIIEQKEAEIAKLKSVVAERGQMSQKELDALKAENGELAKYRAMIDIQADPEFLSKFDQPIEKTVESLKSMLKDMNVSDDIINQVDFTNTKLMDEIIGNVGEHRDKFIARKLQRKVEELVDLTDKRNETLAEQKEKYKETLEARKKQSFEKDAEAEGRALRHLESVAAAKDKAGNSVFPFLNRMQPKETASQLEMEQINAHNKMVDLMQQKVQQAFKMQEPEQRMEVAVAAAAAHYLSFLLKNETALRKSAQAEVQKISAAGTETDKTKPVISRRNGNGSDNLDMDVALNTHFKR